jgi:hypothetical protein
VAGVDECLVILGSKVGWKALVFESLVHRTRKKPKLNCGLVILQLWLPSCAQPISCGCIDLNTYLKLIKTD